MGPENLLESRSPPRKKPCGSDPQLLPVIVKLTDNKPSFKNMHIAERKRIQAEIIEIAGEPKDSSILMGGDMAVHPHDKDQQAILLELKSLQGRPVLCSLPNSSFAYRTGVIFGVPTNDSTEEIQEALADQNVTHVKRLPMRGRPDVLSETVILTFSSPLPDRVKMASMSYQVKVSVPNPYRCYKCWRLGHTSQRCGSNNTHCKKCGRPHPDNIECTTRCVNCGSHTHESDCNECPAFLEMKKILKMAYLEGITVGEARTRVTNLNNASSRRLIPPARLDPQPSQELGLLKLQLQALQSELKSLRESTIPKINEKIGNLTEDLAKTNERFDRFDKRFDDVITKQEENAGSLATRFDKLDGFMNAMMSTFGLKPNLPDHAHQPPLNSKHPANPGLSVNTGHSALLRHDDVMLNYPIPPSPSSYFRLSDQDDMDHSANNDD